MIFNKIKFKRLTEELIHKILKYPIRIYMTSRFNIEVKVNDLDNAEGPYILVGNHVMADDPIIINGFTNRYVRFVASNTNYDTKWKKFFLDLLGSIPFSKNNGDRRAVMKIIKFLKQGYPVGIYPEGGRTWNGETDKIIYSTSKLIKMLKVPVYVSIFKGGYLSKPRWSQRYRKGKLVIEIKKVLDHNTIIKMDVNEIHERLTVLLYHNDYTWQRNNMIPFKGEKLAEYIERTLFQCPGCNKINTLFSIGNKFFCKNCGQENMINKYGYIDGDSPYDNVVDWDKWQKKNLKKINRQSDFKIHSKALLYKFDANGQKIFDGIVNINIQNSVLSISNDKLLDNIFIKKLHALSLTLLDVCEFYSNDQKYRLIFDPKRDISISLFYHTIQNMKKGVIECETIG